MNFALYASNTSPHRRCSEKTPSLIRDRGHADGKKAVSCVSYIRNAIAIGPFSGAGDGARNRAMLGASRPGPGAGRYQKSVPAAPLNGPRISRVIQPP